MKKIVITGASGFLGRNLIRRLEQTEEAEICAVTGRPQKTAGRTVYYGREVIRSSQAAGIFHDAVVINCAFPRNTDGQERAAGMEYIKDVLLCCKRHGACAVVNISSQSVYAAKRSEPARETDPVFLDSVYAAQKYAVELMMEAVFCGTGIPYTSIRLASLIGPGFDVRIVNRLVKQALETGKITVTKDEKRFGFLDIADAVNGLLVLAGSDPASWKPVYNLGTKGAYSLTDIAQSIQRIMAETGAPLVISEVPGEGNDSSALDAGRFYADFGFFPEISLEESIRRIRSALVYPS